MKKYVALGILCSVLMGADAMAARGGAPAVRGGGRAPAAASGGVSARAAAPQAGMNKVSGGVTSAAGATSARAAVKRGATGGTSGGTAKTGGVSARAATTQKAINTSTKVAEANANIVVSDECKNKYYGCMDSFCMLDNTNGGRCLCSDRHAELETVLAEIQKLDEQSYEMATTGVERINLGESADDVNAMVDNITKSMTKKEEVAKKKKTLNLDAWNVTFDDEDNVFDTTGMSTTMDLSNKTGNELHTAVMGVCAKQIPECATSMNMLKMMYSQQIKADCGAYENSLKQQKNASAKKLQTAQQALREAALEQYQNANKYDLGQCTIRFKECMQTTAGCGNDFSKCASDVAMENAQAKAGTTRKNKNHTIKMDKQTITITASTYNTLLGKKVMCESVTKQCQKVKDKVWESFLVSVAPELKSAELIAESNIRTNCMTNISECFQKACKDTMDPNDPEGSYDMCLSRPETIRSVCKVQIEPCEQADSNILEYVYARLRSMRVDSCTKEVKQCLQAEDRCGENYTNCVGLDTDTIIYQMCPAEKLTACNTDESGKKVTDQTQVIENITQIIQGIILNIDNSSLTACQNAANQAMIKVCGETENCDKLTMEENAGARSLEYKICRYTTSAETGEAQISSACYLDISAIDDNTLKVTQGVDPLGGFILGTIPWGDVTISSDGKLTLPDEDKMAANSEWTAKVKSEMQQVQRSIDSVINAIESDPTVKACMEGKYVQGLKRGKSGTVKSRAELKESSDDVPEARYPNLTDSMRTTITASALRVAKENYNKKYAELNEKLITDYATLSKRISDLIAKANAEKAAEELTKARRAACLGLPTIKMLPLAKVDNNARAKAAILKNIGLSLIGMPFWDITMALDISSATKAPNEQNNKSFGNLVSKREYSEWNYKESIETTFHPDSGSCTMCKHTQKCKKERRLSKTCKTWEDEKTSCEEKTF